MNYPQSTAAELSASVIPLLKGVVYRDTHERVWHSVLKLRAHIADYVSVMGLLVVIDEAEGYAYLKSKPDDELDDTDGANPGRLVRRHQLSFHVSILIALLRRRLAEFDTADGESRLILTRGQVIELVRVFLPESSNEARLMNDIDGLIEKVRDLGFLRRVKNQEDTFEVRRVLKAFVDAEWLSGFETKLAEYEAQLTGEPAEGEDDD